MGTFGRFRKAYGALKDSTTVGLAKVNSEFKDLDIAIVKATNHVERPPKERHVRKIFSATSVMRPRADVVYCIRALSRRLAKTRDWIVAIKTLIVIHRTLREGDPIFRDELLNYSYRGNILQISNFKDDSSPLAWDCSAWVRTYANFLEERLECFRILQYDIETERVTKSVAGETKVHCRTRLLNGEELLDQLPALQQLLYRLTGCQPEGAACNNFLIQYALALVLKESFKIYCAVNDGIINLVDMFFDMSKNDAIKALSIYKKAGQQAENLDDFYEFCRGLDLARNFQFPKLRQPPPSFLATMEEYIKEGPQKNPLSRGLESETSQEPQEPEEPVPEESEKPINKVENKAQQVETEDEPQPKNMDQTPPLISTGDTGATSKDPLSTNHGLSEIGNTSGWEVALVSTPSNINHHHLTESKLAGGFDKLLLNSLYEDDAARRQLQLQNAGYGTAYGFGLPEQNQFNQQDPFLTSSSTAPPTNVQMAVMSQQQQMMLQQQQQNMMTMVSHQYSPYSQQQMPYMGPSNPFYDPFSYPQSALPPQGNHMLL